MTQRLKVAGDRFHPQVPDGAMYVGRESPYLKRSPFHNPYRVGRPYTLAQSRDLFRDKVLPFLDLTPLRGQDLACWCPLNAEWCHADDLLTEANR